MQLSLKTDYALRMLMALTVADDVLPVDRIADRYAISRNHLAKVAQHLHTAGYIETIRGRNGGLRLALPPAAINVGELVRRFERLEGFVGCMGNGEECAIDGLCGLKPALAGALEAFLAHLDQLTLADITANRHAMRDRLLAA